MFIAKYEHMDNFRKREEIIDIPETCVETEKRCIYECYGYGI